MHLQFSSKQQEKNCNFSSFFLQKRGEVITPFAPLATPMLSGVLILLYSLCVLHSCSLKVFSLPCTYLLDVRHTLACLSSADLLFSLLSRTSKGLSKSIVFKASCQRKRLKLILRFQHLSKYSEPLFTFSQCSIPPANWRRISMTNDRKAEKHLAFLTLYSFHAGFKEVQKSD